MHPRGQILLYILLVMGVALSVGVAVSQRSLTSLKDSVVGTESAECLAAAEAGIEDALQLLSVDPPEPPNVNLCAQENLDDGSWDDLGTPANQSNLDSNIRVCDLDANSCGGPSLYPNPPSNPNASSDVAYCIWRVGGEFKQTSVAQDTTLNIPIRGDVSIRQIDIHWENPDAVPSFSLFARHNIDETVAKFDVGVYDSSGTGACVIGAGNDPASATASDRILTSGALKINVPIPDPGGVYFTVLLRLRFLCGAPGEVLVEAKNNGGQHVDMPTQYYQAKSTCLNKGTAKELSIVKSLPQLPTIFDFGLFSGSSTVPLSPTN